MAHAKPMTKVRIESDLMIEVRSLPLGDISDIKRIDHLIRLGMKYVK
jgi:hypothetical protein